MLRLPFFVAEIIAAEIEAPVPTRFAFLLKTPRL